MYDCRQFFINGEWLTPTGRKESLVINPATEQPVGRILLGTAADVDAAVKAARAAFVTYSQTSREERIALLERIVKVYEANIERLAQAVSDEMGAPMMLAVQAQAGSGFRHLSTALTILKDFEFEERIGTTLIAREPIGVCGLIQRGHTFDTFDRGAEGADSGQQLLHFSRWRTVQLVVIQLHH